MNLSEFDTRWGEMKGKLQNVASDRAEMYYQKAQDGALSLHSRGEQCVREYPREALLSALAGGFLIGLLLRR